MCNVKPALNVGSYFIESNDAVCLHCTIVGNKLGEIFERKSRNRSLIAHSMSGLINLCGFFTYINRNNPLNVLIINIATFVNCSIKCTRYF